MKLWKRVLKVLGLKKPRRPLPPEVRQWYVGKELTTDWLTSRLRFWFPALQYLRDTEARVLEIGSFEGRSAIAFLEMLPKSHVTTVDIFDKPAIEERCRKNLASYGDRVEIIKMSAAGALESLSDRRFDVIYLDAAKTQHGAFARSALSWPLLNLGGTIIWYDLKWDAGPNEWDTVLPGQRPGPGILLFCSAFKPCMSVVHQAWQLIARKTKDWP